MIPKTGKVTLRVRSDNDLINFFIVLENSPKESTRADKFKTMSLQFNKNTELARVVDVMMAQAKRIYILMIKVNKLFFFSPSWYFLKEIVNMFSVFLSSYRNTCESLGEIAKFLDSDRYKHPVLYGFW